jgi:hypothetical protein
MSKRRCDVLVLKAETAIAAEHDMTVDQVHAAFDQHPIETNKDLYLRRQLARACSRSMNLVHLPHQSARWRRCGWHVAGQDQRAALKRVGMGADPHLHLLRRATKTDQFRFG